MYTNVNAVSGGEGGGKGVFIRCIYFFVPFAFSYMVHYIIRSRPFVIRLFHCFLIFPPFSLSLSRTSATNPRRTIDLPTATVVSFQLSFESPSR